MFKFFEKFVKSCSVRTKLDLWRLTHNLWLILYESYNTNRGKLNHSQPAWELASPIIANSDFKSASTFSTQLTPFIASLFYSCRFGFSFKIFNREFLELEYFYRQVLSSKCWRWNKRIFNEVNIVKEQQIVILFNMTWNLKHNLRDRYQFFSFKSVFVTWSNSHVIAP